MGGILVLTEAGIDLEELMFVIGVNRDCAAMD